jgi:hypothetical protein
MNIGYNNIFQRCLHCHKQFKQYLHNLHNNIEWCNQCSKLLETSESVNKISITDSTLRNHYIELIVEYDIDIDTNIEYLPMSKYIFNENNLTKNSAIQWVNSIKRNIKFSKKYNVKKVNVLNIQ